MHARKHKIPNLDLREKRFWVVPWVNNGLLIVASWVCKRERERERALTNGQGRWQEMGLGLVLDE